MWHVLYVTFLLFNTSGSRFSFFIAYEINLQYVIPDTVCRLQKPQWLTFHVLIKIYEHVVGKDI